ncbi:PP2C family protein-serine/threonine phosphatase [Paractinoplanes lichenicola]|uniref:Serine/threonine-protein phosphatase n=1 Tax=Paractinoplanes lichenicola TaxID=2802976 RepID=A0ABS1VTQ8_9ACTN|nr:PP2C family protein-serine/threonine phosphatase [Actinoplanes lichenicola]MBL7257858.1 serine/threonine-protein phosphatase [Actinoplanes lichenicola]
MSEAGMRWAKALHRLWSAVVVIHSREQLADLVLPPLQELPGVRAVWGLRHATAGDGVLAYRWQGVPLTEDRQAVAAGLAPKQAGPPRVVPVDLPGITTMVICRFDEPGQAAGTIMVGVDGSADTAFVAECLRQVVEVSQEAVRRLAAMRDEQQQLMRDALLAEASLQMDAVLDTTQTMYRVPRMAVPAIAEGCLVFVHEDGKPVLRSAVHVDMRRLDAMLREPGAVERLATPGEHSQVLRARGRVIGLLVFLFDRDPDRIPPATFLRDLAARAALAIDNSTLYEQRRQEVVRMQQHLLPTRLPHTAGLELAASYTVGDRVLEVGGDFYDVVVRGGGEVAAVIGDVCGRGVDAAALTGMARHTLAALLHEGLSPARALTRLNARLRLDGSWRFITAAVALIRPDGTVEWTSAGHPAPAVLPVDGEPRRGAGGGVPLGILDEPRLKQTRLELAAGETLLMFTDGLTESRDADGRMFEERALGAALHRLRGTGLQQLIDELSSAAEATDDIALLGVQRSAHE